MNESTADRSIRVEKSVVGSAIISGDGNTIYVIQQTTEQKREQTEPKNADDIGPNPYKGLSAFKESDAARYFGREVQIERLWQRFQALYDQSKVSRFLPILGPSGCGKSSLARAGFIPELARKPLPGKENMRVAVLMPGARPLEALAGVLAKAVTGAPFPLEKAEEFEQVLKKQNEVGGYEGLRRIANLIPDIRDMPLVILVDQFEEVYSLCQDTEHRQAFINNLLHAASEPTGEVSVVITLRSDFWAETQRHERLNQAIGSDYVVTMPAMTVTELRSAIAEPAQLAGQPLEEATIDLLVKDTDGREGALPLLQVALTRIWEGLKVGETATETYREMGGVGGALAGEAQDIYERLTCKEQEISRRVFIGLVQLGEGTRDTRRRATIESLVARQDTLEAVKQVIDRFSAPSIRLVTLANEANQETAEVTHEALFDSWTLLKDWLDTGRDDIRFQRRLESAATSWSQQERPNGSLWRFPDLDLLQTFSQKFGTEMTPLSTAFLEASTKADKDRRDGIQRQEKERKRQRRNLLITLISGFTVSIVAAGVAIVQLHKAEWQRMKLYEATAKRLEDEDPLQSLAHAIVAVSMGRSLFLRFPNITGEHLVPEEVLLPSVSATSSKLFRGHESPVKSVDFSPKGEAIVSGSQDGTIRLWDLKGTPTIEPIQVHKNAIEIVKFSLDGNMLISGSKDGDIRLWDLAGKSIGTPMEGNEGGIKTIELHPKGQFIISISRGGELLFWDLKNTSLIFYKRLEKSIEAVFWGADYKSIVAIKKGGGMDEYDLTGNLLSQAIDPFQLTSISSIDFNHDTQVMVTGGWNGINTWKTEGSFQYKKNINLDFPVSALAVSSDGQLIAGGSASGKIRLWDSEGREFKFPFHGHEEDILSLDFSPNAQHIVSGSHDGTLRLWSLNRFPHGRPFEDYGVESEAVAFSSNGERIAAGNSNGSVNIWNVMGTQIQSLSGGGGQKIYSIAFSPDGKIIASGSADGMVYLWNLDQKKITKELPGHVGEVFSVGFSPDGKTIITGGRDGTIRFWNLKGDSIRPPLKAHEEAIFSISFSHDGQKIVSGSKDGTVRLWNSKGQPIGHSMQGHQGEVYSVTFNHDGTAIASGSTDGTIRLWDLLGNLLEPPFDGHEAAIESVVFSLDGEIIFSGSLDGTVRLWDLQGHALGEPFRGHEGKILALALDMETQTIVTSGEDGTVRLWSGYPWQGWLNAACEDLFFVTTPNKIFGDANRACRNYN